MPDLKRPSASGRLANIVFTTTGLILLTAAVLKGYQLSTGQFVSGDVVSTPTVAAVVVTAEIALGVWLCAGPCPAAARVAAVACFGTFLVVSIRQLAVGRVSCGCFGVLQVAPWATAGLDIAVVLALVWIRPPHPRESVLTRGLLVVMVAVAAAAWGWWTVTPDGPNRLTPSPAVVALGDVHQGQTVPAELVVTNTLRSEVAIHRFESSCPCLAITPQELVLAPAQSVRLKIVLDLAKEPDFTGSLSVRVHGLGSQGEVVLDFPVEITVRKPAK